MKIALISTLSGVHWGGSEELWATMVDEAVKEDLEVAVSVCHEAVIPARFQALHSDAVRKYRRRRLFMYRVDQAISKIASPFRDIFRWNPDVICISQGSTYESAELEDLLNLLYKAAKPYVVICQYSRDDAGRSDEIKLLTKNFFKRAFRVVFVSKRNLASVERQLAQTITNAIILQNPVNLSDLSEAHYLPSKRVSIANVARLRAGDKGQDILLEVLSSKIWRSRDWQLRLYGEGNDKNYLKALAQHYGIDERVDFCGQVDDIRAVWQVNHLLALPSRNEGTPLALVEAMLCGRPAVVTDVGGNAEWIEDGRTGFVAEGPTTKSFGAAMERAWIARDSLHRMGVQARERALNKFDRSPGKTLLGVLLDAANTSPSRRQKNHNSIVMERTQSFASLPDTLDGEASTAAKSSVS